MIMIRLWGYAGTDLDELPMRRTDNARIIDTATHTLTSPGEWRQEPVYVRRKKRKAAMPEEGDAAAANDEGRIEAQQRLMIGKLPVAYRCARACMPCPPRLLLQGMVV